MRREHDCVDVRRIIVNTSMTVMDISTAVVYTSTNEANVCMMVVDTNVTVVDFDVTVVDMGMITAATSETICPINTSIIYRRFA